MIKACLSIKNTEINSLQILYSRMNISRWKKEDRKREICILALWLVTPEYFFFNRVPVLRLFLECALCGFSTVCAMSYVTQLISRVFPRFHRPVRCTKPTYKYGWLPRLCTRHVQLKESWAVEKSVQPFGRLRMRETDPKLKHRERLTDFDWNIINCDISADERGGPSAVA